MSRTYFIYVPAAPRSQRNLELGLRLGHWGWRQDTLGGANGNHARAIRAGDLLVLATGGPNPRVPVGKWSQATFTRVVMTRTASALARHDEPLWEDALYPWRVAIAVRGELWDDDSRLLGPESREALRMSANKRGAPVLGW